MPDPEPEKVVYSCGEIANMSRTAHLWKGAGSVALGGLLLAGGLVRGAEPPPLSQQLSELGRQALPRVNGPGTEVFPQGPGARSEQRRGAAGRRPLGSRAGRPGRAPGCRPAPGRSGSGCRPMPGDTPTLTPRRRPLRRPSHRARSSPRRGRRSRTSRTERGGFPPALRQRRPAAPAGSPGQVECLPAGSGTLCPQECPELRAHVRRR